MPMQQDAIANMQQENWRAAMAMQHTATGNGATSAPADSPETDEDGEGEGKETAKNLSKILYQINRERNY